MSAKYSRYGQANMNDIIRNTKKWMKKYLEGFSVNDLVGLYNRCLTGNLDDLDEIVGEYTNQPEVIAKLKKDREYIQYSQELFLECKGKQLFISPRTYNKMWDNVKIDFDTKFWSDFDEPITMIEYNRNYTKMYKDMGVKGVSMERITCASKGRFVVFEFNGYSDDADVRKVSKASTAGFYNYGTIVFNRISGSIFIRHTDVKDPRNHFHLSTGGDEFMCEKISSKEVPNMLQRVRETDYRNEVSDDGETIFIRTTLADNLKHIQIAKQALQEYHKAIKSVEGVKTEKTLERRVKQHQAREVDINVVEDAVHDRVIPLTTLMRNRTYEKKEWQGGHHRSPVQHEVSGHYRMYKSGKVVWVNGFQRGGKKNEEGVRVKEDKVTTTAVKI